MSNYPLRRLGKYNGTILECNAWDGWHLYNPRAHSVAITTTSLPSRALLLSALGSRLSAISSFCEGRNCSPTNTNGHSCEGPSLRFLLRWSHSFLFSLVSFRLVLHPSKFWLGFRIFVGLGVLLIDSWLSTFLWEDRSFWFSRSFFVT